MRSLDKKPVSIPGIRRFSMTPPECINGKNFRLLRDRRRKHPKPGKQNTNSLLLLLAESEKSQGNIFLEIVIIE